MNGIEFFLEDDLVAEVLMLVEVFLAFTKAHIPTILIIFTSILLLPSYSHLYPMKTKMKLPRRNSPR